jgi:PAS domain-containing protein
MAEIMESPAYSGRVAPAPAISQALQRALLSWDGLLEWLPIGIYTCDADGHLVQYNRRAAELWGQSPSLDRQHRLCGSHKAFAADGEPLTAAGAPMTELLKTGQPIRDRELIFERPDGTRITILALIGGVNCFQDITERKAAEERLKAREEWYLDLLDALRRHLHDRRRWTHHLLQSGLGRAFRPAPGSRQRRMVRELAASLRRRHPAPP